MRLAGRVALLAAVRDGLQDLLEARMLLNVREQWVALEPFQPFIAAPILLCPGAENG